MKQICIALLALITLAACNDNKKNGIGGNMFGNDPGNNNNNNNGGNNGNGGNGRWNNNGGNNNGGNNGGNTGGNNGTGSWSPALRNQITQGCLTEVGNDPQAKAKCDCWVSKMENRYPQAQNADQFDENTANQLAAECLQNFGGGEYPGGNNPNNGGGYQVNTGGGRGWPQAQRQQWMTGCTTTAQQQQGLTAQQANAYCDCMTTKIEAQYSFEQAARMTVQDFSTPEWVNARMDCQMNTGY